MFIFSTISILSGVLNILIGSMVYFQSRKLSVHKLYFILCLLNACWGILEFLFRQAPDEKTAMFWLRILPVVAAAIPVSLHFTLLYIQKSALLQKKWVWAAIYIPVFAIIISLLFHNYMFDSITKRPWGYAPILAPGSVALHMAILWLLGVNTCTIFFILNHWVKTPDRNEKRQTFIIAIGLITPIAMANISHFLLPILNVAPPGLTTIGTLLQASFIGFAIWKYDLFSINPATAADNIVATMSDIFILLDPQGKILSINRAVTDLLAFHEQDLIRTPINGILSKDVTKQFLLMEEEIEKKSNPPAAIHQSPLKNLEGMFVTKSKDKIPTSVAVSTLWNRNDSIAGYVVIARDITAQKRIESEREGLIKDLQDALSNIKVLRGLLPICSRCKKIRDDEGYWNQMESYIKRYSDAEFSHSICPECSDKLYGNEAWYIEMKKKNEFE